MADPLRESRKHGTDAPGRPTDEFVVHAFAEGARALWPDSRDPGWHATFRRWIERRDAAARVEDAARLAEAVEERQAAWERADFLREGLETATNKAAAHAARLAEVERLADEFDMIAGDHSERLSDFDDGYSCAFEEVHRRLRAALGVTAPTASEAGDDRDQACVDRWPGCEIGAYDPRCCRWPKSCSCYPAPAEASEVEGSGS